MTKTLLALATLLFAGALFAGTPGQDLVAAAKAQIGVTLLYDRQYQRIPYPGGDVPIVRGVCSDVVIRAYRTLGVDLQVLVHQDMVAAWSHYPKLWQLRGTDPNIDHRRVPNLATFFKRHGQNLTVEKDAKAYLPGDIVVWRLSSGLPHIGIVSDELSASRVPLVIHNIGTGARQNDRLFDFTITGHFRYLPGRLNTPRATHRQREG